MRASAPARRLDLRRIKRRFFPRGLRFTRQGKLYVIVTLGVGFAAVNTANNLLFLVLGLMLGLIIVSGILSEVSLRGMQVRRLPPRRVEADTPFPVELALENGKDRASSFGIEVRDEIEGVPYHRRCRVLRIGAGETCSVAYRCVLGRRGRTRFDGVIASTRFPFGLFEKNRFIPLPGEVIVLPARLPVRIPTRRALSGEGAKSVDRKGMGDDFRELRDMAPGDDPRMIHWRSTARLGKPLVRENDQDAGGFAEIVLDAVPAASDEKGLEEVERRIRAAGTLVRDFARQGLTVRLITVPSIVLEAKVFPETYALLEHLALIDPEAQRGESPPKALSPDAILIGPRARSDMPALHLKVPAMLKSRHNP